MNGSSRHKNLSRRQEQRGKPFVFSKQLVLILFFNFQTKTPVSKPQATSSPLASEEDERASSRTNMTGKKLFARCFTHFLSGRRVAPQ